MDDYEKSAWDGRQLYVQELAALRKGLHTSAISHNVQQRYDILICYYKALIARIPIKASTKKNNDKINPKFESHLKYFETIKKHMSQYRIAISKNQRYSDADAMLDLFDEWEILLRQAENDMGLLMPSDNDADFAILE